MLNVFFFFTICIFLWSNSLYFIRLLVLGLWMLMVYFPLSFFFVLIKKAPPAARQYIQPQPLLMAIMIGLRSGFKLISRHEV